MYDYLNFPSQNKVGKKLSNSKYIKSANLTKGEEKRLAPFLGAIEILYSFPFEDGEIIVLLADFSVAERGRFTLNGFVRAVAQSLPYRILLIVRSEGVIRFFSFDEQSNKTDNRRMNVNRVYASQDIILIKNDFMNDKLISDLRNSVFEADSAEDLHNRWNLILYSNSNDKYIVANNIIDDTFMYSIAEYNKRLRIEKNFDRLTEKNYTYENDKYDLYIGEPLEIDEASDHRLFIEFCAYYARILYEEIAFNYEFSEENWLRKYLDACSSLAQNLFRCVLDGRCASIISSEFWNDGENYIESADCYDVEDLKELIGYFYFAESEE